MPSPPPLFKIQLPPAAVSATSSTGITPDSKRVASCGGGGGMQNTDLGEPLNVEGKPSPNEGAGSDDPAMTGIPVSSIGAPPATDREAAAAAPLLPAGGALS